MSGSREPIRTCVGCGAKFAKRHLRRFVRDCLGELILDPDNQLPGRGAYLCSNPACLKKAVAKKSFSRTLRAPVRISEPETLMDRWGRSECPVRSMPSTMLEKS